MLAAPVILAAAAARTLPGSVSLVRHADPPAPLPKPLLLVVSALDWIAGPPWYTQLVYRELAWRADVGWPTVFTVIGPDLPDAFPLDASTLALPNSVVKSLAVPLDKLGGPV